MASAVRDAVKETIEIVDQLEGKQQKKGGLKAWIVIPVGLVVAFSLFMVVRRIFAPGDEF
jgi:hypothetical protein